MKPHLYLFLFLFLFPILIHSSCGTGTADYQQIVTDNATYTRELLQSYRAAESEEQKAAVLRKTRNHIFNLFSDQLFSYWYGTKYDAQGTTDLPRSGGTSPTNFVATLMQDANFNVDRVALAQQSPQNMLLTFCDKKYIRQYNNETMDDFVQHLHEIGTGLYLLALDDTNIGFLTINSCGIRFVHASPTFSGVKNEDAALSDVIRDAKKRRVAMLLDSDWTVRKWLANDVFVVGGQPASANTPPAPATQQPKEQPAKQPEKATKSKRTEL